MMMTILMAVFGVGIAGAAIFAARAMKREASRRARIKRREQRRNDIIFVPGVEDRR